MEVSVTRQLRDLFTWAVLTLVPGCGGQVVVDPDPGSSDEMTAVRCDAYCNLVSEATESCGIYRLCMDDCIDDFAGANASGCVTEMEVMYDCYSAAFRRTGLCETGCGELYIAFHKCREDHGFDLGDPP